MEGAVHYTQRLVAEMAPELEEGARQLLEATRDGLSLGDVLGVSKEQKQALLDLGCGLAQAGQLEKACDVLLRLVQLDPLEERAIYALGTVCQTRGELHKAAQLYLQFLALDATNPIGYLRLGECLLAAKEFAQARAAILTARDLAEDGKGHPGNLEEAVRLLEVPEIANAEPEQAL